MPYYGRAFLVFLRLLLHYSKPRQIVIREACLVEEGAKSPARRSFLTSDSVKKPAPPKPVPRRDSLEERIWSPKARPHTLHQPTNKTPVTQPPPLSARRSLLSLQELQFGHPLSGLAAQIGQSEPTRDPCPFLFGRSCVRQVTHSQSAQHGTVAASLQVAFTPLVNTTLQVQVWSRSGEEGVLGAARIDSFSTLSRGHVIAGAIERRSRVRHKRHDFSISDFFTPCSHDPRPGLEDLIFLGLVLVGLHE